MPRLSPTTSVFGRRLRQARQRAGVAQDRLGVAIGLDEESSSARISRYETGTHEPNFRTASRIAAALGVPVAFLFCDDDEMARAILAFAGIDQGRRGRVLALMERAAAR